MARLVPYSARTQPELGLVPTRTRADVWAATARSASCRARESRTRAGRLGLVPGLETSFARRRLVPPRARHEKLGLTEAGMR